jgi:hypothetical protein
MDFMAHLAALGADQAWIGQYLDFLTSTIPPEGRSHRHHILPRALFPEFAKLKMYPMNCKRLTPSDHFVAHYYLYRALPKNPVAYLSFLKMASVTRLSALVQSGYDETLVREMSLEYERIRSGAASLDGWSHIYRGKLRTVCPEQFLEKMKADGWTQEAPPRQWVHKGKESCRIPVEKTQEYLEQGFVLGRPAFHTPESKKRISEKTSAQHQAEATKGEEAYSYMPHGEEHVWFGKERDERTKGKIRKTLTGVSKPPSRPIHQGIAKGKHWSWSEEAKHARSESMKGKKPTNGLTMEGRTHSEETKELMSESHKEFYASNPDGVAALNAARPRGENHVWFGKERDKKTRDAISKSLEGKTQSKATRQTRSESLKAFHAAKKSRKNRQSWYLSRGT